MTGPDNVPVEVWKCLEEVAVVAELWNKLMIHTMEVWERAEEARLRAKVRTVSL